MFRSLSARLFAILTVGLGAIQIVSFFGFIVFRGEEIKEQITRFLGADISFAYDFMRSLPREQRPEWLARLNQGFHYRFSLEPATGTIENVMPDDERLARLSAILKADLPPEAQLTFRLPPGVPASVRDKAIQTVLSIDDDERLVLHLFDPFSLPSEGALLGYLGVVLLAVTPFVCRSCAMAARICVRSSMWRRMRSRMALTARAAWRSSCGPDSETGGELGLRPNCSTAPSIRSIGRVARRTAHQTKGVTASSTTPR